MVLLLIIPLLISGFRYSHLNPHYFYRLHQQEGQYLYIHAAHLGTQCFAVSMAVNVLLVFTFSIFSCFVSGSTSHVAFTAALFEKHLLLKPNESRQAAWYLFISVFSIFPVPQFLTYLHTRKNKNRFSSKDLYKTFIIGELVRNNPLDYFLLNAALTKQVVMLSMRDRKVYVGQIARTSEPNETQAAAQEIEIVPAMSGFRHKDNLSVKLTTMYEEIDHDFTLILRQDEILSATYFETDIFYTFQDVANTYNKFK